MEVHDATFNLNGTFLISNNIYISVYVSTTPRVKCSAHPY